MPSKKHSDYIINGDVTVIKTYNSKGIKYIETIVDSDKVDEIKKGKISKGGKQGYIQITIDGSKILLHRFITKCPIDMVVDHINHNVVDNRIKNLRICTRQQNMLNQKINSKNTSGHKGVCWNNAKQKWSSYITFNNKSIKLGNHKKIEDAIIARKQAEEKYYGEFKCVVNM